MVLTGGQGATAETEGRELQLLVATGELQTFAVGLGYQEARGLEAELGPLEAIDGKATPEGVRLEFTDPKDPPPARWPDKPAIDTIRVSTAPGGAEFHLRLMARRCSAPGTFRAPLWLRPTGAPEATRVELPVVVEVRSQGPCGSIFLGAGGAALAPLLLGFVLFCGLRMVGRSRFVSVEGLAQKLTPLRWVGGQPVGDPSAKQQSMSSIREGLGFADRAGAWLRGWLRRVRNRPLDALGFGSGYREILKVHLTHRPEGLSLRAIPEHEGPHGSPPSGSLDPCTLFVVASQGGGSQVLGFPNTEGRLGYLEIEPAPDSGRAGPVTLRGKRLLHRDEELSGPAGWEIG
jgi:hypothetical protein